MTKQWTKRELFEEFCCKPKTSLTTRKNSRKVEKYKFEIGDTAYSTKDGSYKEGTPVIIKDRHMNNGYVSYFGGGLSHRSSDLTSIKG